MDQAWEMIGIVIAILMIIIGLRWLIKKPQTLPEVNAEDLQVEATSQQPILPRHVREAMLTKLGSPSITETRTTVDTEKAEVASAAQVQSTSSVATAQTAQSTEKTDLDTIKAELEDEKALVAEAEKVIGAETAKDVKAETAPVTQATSESDVEREDEHPKEEMRSLNLSDEDWENESTVFDAHLSEQDRHDEESPLATAEKFVTFSLYPNPERALSGERTLNMLKKYGLRYGEMACFHRYEHTDQVSPLMFSVLRMQEDGAPTGFDLENLPTEEVKGLAFFLALPNPNALQGFDMMASFALLMARDINGCVFDESGLELTPQLREHLRHEVIEYDPNQTVE